MSVSKLKISLIIPTHNREQSLKRLLDNIFSLNFNVNFEIVIVDNNSSYGTASLVKSLNKNIKYVFEGNTSFTRARHTGAQNATGDIFVYLDDDVILSAGTLEEIENFSLDDQSNWGNKQKNVLSIISYLSPKTVLDLGVNTGWFSVLAAKNGAKVIATDIDESSIDLLYQKSKKENLDIVSLFMPFDDLTKEQYGIDYKGEGYEGREFKKNPLFLSPVNRLKSELVFCLALVHHLVLGEGKNIKDVFKVLSGLTSKTLVLEYISLEDNVIKNEPSFFKNLSKHAGDLYNLDLFIKEGKKFFKDVEVLESHPSTRKLLVFSK